MIETSYTAHNTVQMQIIIMKFLMLCCKSESQQHIQLAACVRKVQSFFLKRKKRTQKHFHVCVYFMLIGAQYTQKLVILVDPGKRN